MAYDDHIIDREVGRNAQLFSQSIAEMDTAAERYPYLRILVSIIEQAHPEWKETINKSGQIAHLIDQLSGGAISEEEVEEVVQMRDAEQKAKRRN